MPLEIYRAEELMNVKSVEALCSPVGGVWKFGEREYLLKCHPRHSTVARNYDISHQLPSWCLTVRSKREDFVDDDLIYAKSLCEELEISFEPPRRIRRKHIFGDGSENVQLSYEDDLRRTMFSSTDRVTAEIRERFQQLQNLAQKYAF
ncbi:uncharacterized protein TNCV_4957931 [Trichonephila clavipes]|nr:uncharacterized protein TNCV_4957931 [Trichonephila clavipes]